MGAVFEKLSEPDNIDEVHTKDEIKRLAGVSDSTAGYDIFGLCEIGLLRPEEEGYVIPNRVKPHKDAVKPLLRAFRGR